MVKGHAIFYSRRPAIDLCSYDGFLLFFMEMYHRHGGGSLALCHRGGEWSDTFFVVATVCAVIMARSVPSLGSAVSTGFPSWRIICI
jgi:hypothetical protein